MLNEPVNDNDSPPVTLITGRAKRDTNAEAVEIHVLLLAPDDDSAVRRTLDALKERGFAEAELDQIGQLDGEPDEEPHLSAYQGAMEGEVSIVVMTKRG